VLDAEASQVLGKLKGWAVGMVDEKDMIARAQDGEHHGADRGHAGGEALARLPPFQRGELAFGGRHGWVPAARIDVSLVLGVKSIYERREGREREEGCLDDGGGRGNATLPVTSRLIRDTDLDIGRIDQHAGTDNSVSLHPQHGGVRSALLQIRRADRFIYLGDVLEIGPVENRRRVLDVSRRSHPIQRGGHPRRADHDQKAFAGQRFAAPSLWQQGIDDTRDPLIPGSGSLGRDHAELAHQLLQFRQVSIPPLRPALA
jgi:hypothetical protein